MESSFMAIYGLVYVDDARYVCSIAELLYHLCCRTMLLVQTHKTRSGACC